MSGLETKVLLLFGLRSCVRSLHRAAHPPRHLSPLFACVCSIRPPCLRSAFFPAPGLRTGKSGMCDRRQRPATRVAVLHEAARATDIPPSTR